MSDEPLALSTILPAQSAAADAEMPIAVPQTHTAAARAGSESILPPQQLDPSSTEPDIVSAAERLSDIAWRMRACGVESATSDQIEQIAQAILSASALRNPADHRAQKLAEVPGYLEHRIDRLLDGHWQPSRAQADEPGTMPADPAPAQPAASGESSPDSIALQVEEDLLSLTEFPLHASVPAETSPPRRQPPGEAAARAKPSGLPAVPAIVAERSDAWSPVPSMWEPPESGTTLTAASGRHPQPQFTPAGHPAFAELPSSEIAAQVIATTMAPRPRTGPLPRRQADHPLAALMAMSEEERIALFT